MIFWGPAIELVLFDVYRICIKNVNNWVYI